MAEKKIIKKFQRVCCEPALNPDYACNQCGGDIRGIKCCSKEYCEIFEINEEDTNAN